MQALCWRQRKLVLSQLIVHSHEHNALACRAHRLQDVPLGAAAQRQDALGAQHVRRVGPPLPQQLVQPQAQPAVRPAPACGSPELDV